MYFALCLTVYSPHLPVFRLMCYITTPRRAIKDRDHFWLLLKNLESIKWDFRYFAIIMPILLECWKKVSPNPLVQVISARLHATRSLANLLLLCQEAHVVFFFNYRSYFQPSFIVFFTFSDVIAFTIAARA